MPTTGRGAAEDFAELAARTGEWDACALAPCLALRVPRPDAEIRVREVRPLCDEFEAGEEGLVAIAPVAGTYSATPRRMPAAGCWRAGEKRWNRARPRR